MISNGTKIILFALLLLLSCSKEERIYRNGESEPVEYAPSEELIFTAGQDSPVTDDCTRTLLNDTTVTFSAGDSVSLLSAKNANVKLTTQFSGAKARLTGLGINDNQYYAVYPYSTGAVLNDSIITGFSIPTEQTATAGTYDPKASIIFASSVVKSLQFHNLCALLTFIPESGKEQPAIDHITVSFTGVFAAAGKINLKNVKGDASIATDSTASSSVTLKGKFTGGTSYYIVIAPNTYSSVTITTFDSDGRLIFSKSVHKNRSFAAGKIYNLGNIPISGLGHGETDGHQWVQLKNNGPKWSVFNLGSTITDYSQANGDNTKAWGATGSVWNTATCGNFYENQSSAVPAVWSGWKMPSANDVQIDLCGSSNYIWTWCDGTDKQFVSGCTLTGYKISGKGDYAGNTLFLPAAGYLNSSGKYTSTGTYGYYFYGISGKSLKFYSGFKDPNFYPYNGAKYSIRPVAAE